MAKHRNSWMSLSLDAWSMGVEAQQVIGLRLAKMALGGAGAADEATLMVSEKMQTAMATQGAAVLALMSGQAGAIPARTLVAYRRKVSANRRRLLKGFG
jgi:hypothetical protein